MRRDAVPLCGAPVAVLATVLALTGGDGGPAPSLPDGLDHGEPVGRSAADRPAAPSLAGTAGRGMALPPETDPDGILRGEGGAGRSPLAVLQGLIGEGTAGYERARDLAGAALDEEVRDGVCRLPGLRTLLGTGVYREFLARAVADDDASAELRRVAAAGLERAGDPELSAILALRVRAESDAAVLTKAIRVLSGWRDPRGAAALGIVLERSSERPHHRRAVLQALAAREDPGTDALLDRARVSDPDAEVRASASLLRLRRDPPATGFLVVRPPPTRACEAGLRAGDLVLSVDGVEVPDAATLGTAVRAAPGGDLVDVVVHREGRSEGMRIDRRSFPGDGEFVRPRSRPDPQPPGPQPPSTSPRT